MPANQLSLLKILVVDDDRTINKLVCQVLARLGFKDITVANSGRAAIAAATKDPFDFIITDWRMCDLDGIDLVRFVRTSPSSPNPMTPMIMLTGNTEAHYVITALNSGINGYLIKPFSAEQLVLRIRNIIEKPRDFVFSSIFRGPDRRHSEKGPPPSGDRRASYGPRRAGRA